VSRTYTTPTTLPGGLLATVMRVAVHKPSQSADHGEGVTHVAIEDEGGGPFLLLEQPVPFDTREAGIAIDLAELEAVAIVARALINQPGLQDSEPGAAPDQPDHPEQALDMVLTESYLDEPSPPTHADTLEVLRRCIGALLACEDRISEDAANLVAPWGAGLEERSPSTWQHYRGLQELIKLAHDTREQASAHHQALQAGGNAP
jgi:hypothetical protein